MKLHVLKCPECHANLEIEEGLKTCYCKYCGCQINIDEEKHEHTINKNIHKRYTDDADVIRAKTEDKESRRTFKAGIAVWVILIVMVLALPLGLHINKTIAQNEGKISAGYYKDLVGKDYKTVEAHFEAAGFTDIQLVDLEDSGLMFWSKGKVDTISVGGDTSFESSDWFYPDTKVIISYH